MDPEKPGDWAGLEGRFDTVLCLNVLEYVEDPDRVLAFMRAALKPNGDAVILVPNSPGLFGTLDRSLGHRRRYTASGVRRLLESRGFSVDSIRSFNKAGAPPWWVYSKALGAKTINKAVLKVFDKTIWFWSRVDRWMPWPGLTLIAVAHNPGDTAVSGETAGAAAVARSG
jgi:SAM-dependent methyltransferase